MEKIKNIKSPFMYYCAKVIPLAFDESMSYYECLCNFYNYLKNEVMPVINNNADATKELQDSFIELENYVNHYFDNLDIQEEINNKLDDMYENGQLTSLITEYLQLKTTYTFDTLSDMQQATNFINGCYAKTLGYNELNDGGASYYKIRTKTNEDVIDDIFIVELDDDTLIAELILQNKINIRQAGISGDENEDATTLLTKVFAKDYDIYFPSGTYVISDTLTLISHKIYGDIKGDSIIKIGGENNIQLLNSNNLNNLYIENLKFDLNTLTDTLQSNINLFNTNGLTIKNCEFTGGNGNHLKLNGSSNVVIKDSYFHDIIGDTGNPGECIYCNGITNLTIENCKCTNVMDHFLYLDGSNSVNKVYINNCNLEYTGKDNIITNGGAIAIYGDCKNITISNNIIKNCKSAINSDIRNLITPENVTIYSNDINNNSQDGIYFTCNNGNIYNNHIYENGQDGLNIRNSKNININNNQLNNNTRNGLAFRKTNYINVNNCDIYDNAMAGLIVGYDSSTNCDHVYINSCKIYRTDSGTQITGLQLLYGDDIRVLSCSCFNNTANWDTQRSTVTNFVSQLNSDRESQVNSLMYRSAIPTGSTYKVGDTILYTSPVANGYIGAVCVTAGSPGTWKEFGKIEN